MIGVSKKLKICGQVCEVTVRDLERLLGNRSVASGIYERENGDRTSQLPLNKHMAWAAKGWTLVEVTSLAGMDDPRATFHVAPKPAA